jgi:hypothetical protein
MKNKTFFALLTALAVSLITLPAIAQPITVTPAKRFIVALNQLIDTKEVSPLFAPK